MEDHYFSGQYRDSLARPDWQFAIDQSPGADRLNQEAWRGNRQFLQELGQIVEKTAQQGNTSLPN
jgi:hypothetical protein